MKKTYIGLVAALALLLVPEVKAQQDVERDPDYLAGVAAMEDGFYAAAVPRFESFIKNTASVRRKAYGYLFLFQSLYELRQYGRIIELLGENWEMFRGTRYLGAAFYWQARAKYATGNYNDAIHTLRNFEIEFPGDEFLPYAMRLNGQALREAGRLAEAEVQFNAFEARFPGRAEVPENRLDLASVLIKLNRGEEASLLLEALADEYPNNVAAHRARLWMSQAALERKELDVASRWIAGLTTDDRVPREIRSDGWFLAARIAVEQESPTNALYALQQGGALTTNTEKQVESRIDQARLLMDLGRLNEATEIMNNTVITLAATPQAARVQLELADLLRGQSRYDKAVEAYQRYLESFSDPAGVRHALYSKAWCLWQLNQFNEAGPAFEKAYAALRNETLREQAIAKAADSYFMSQQYRQAATLYAGAASEFPESKSRLQWIYQSGESYARIPDFTNAVQALTEVTGNPAADPSLAATALTRLGRFYEKQRKPESALGAYTDFLQRFPENETGTGIRLSRGNLSYRLGDYAAARDDFEAVINTASSGSGEYQQALFLAAWCDYQSGDAKAGVEQVRAFIADYPESPYRPDVLFWLAEHHFNVRAFRSAESNFYEVAQQFPTNRLAPASLYWAGRAAMEQKVYRRALDEYLVPLIKLYPGHELVPEARFAQGDALTELGDFSGAILAFEQIATRYPDHELAIRARGRIGDCQFTLGAEKPERYPAALETFRSILSHPRATRELMLQAEYKLARTYEKLGRNDDAATHYLNVVYGWLAAREEGLPVDEVWFVRSAFSVAAIKEAASDWDGARAVYSRVAFSGTGAAGDAKIRIDRMRNRGQNTNSEPAPEPDIPPQE